MKEALLLDNETDCAAFYGFQAKHKETGVLAAAKMCRLETDEDLDDFRVEIDILADCKHPNVVTLFDAYCFDSKLWVRY